MREAAVSVGTSLKAQGVLCSIPYGQGNLDVVCHC